MVISFLKNLFGGDTEGQPEGKPTATPKATPRTAAAAGDASVEEFVRYVVAALVDSPGDVSVATVEKGPGVEIQISCAKKDIGKVIGRSGRTIGAIRALANGAAGRLGQKISVEVLD